MVGAAQAVGDVARGLPELGQILADAEPATGAGDHDCPHLAVPRLLQGRRERLVHGPVEGVEDVRTVQRQR